jgi:hypothetical protein
MFFQNMDQQRVKMKGIQLLLTFMTAAAGTASAATWYVDESVIRSGNGKSWPTAFKWIQKGIDAASDGDTVLVAEGAYAENIDFKGKNIVLSSTDPLDFGVVTNTIIDGGKSDSVVAFLGTENSTCVLSGFKIANGQATLGGGIRGGGLKATQATIENNVITDNEATFGGGLYGCRGIVRNNRIISNSAQSGGGLAFCSGTIHDNIIMSNTAQDGDGGGLWNCAGTIRENSIFGNSAIDSDDSGDGNGGGLANCDGTIKSNAIIGNSTDMGDGAGLADCDGIIEDNRISGNSAAGIPYLGIAYGGGLANCDGTIQNNVVTGNSAIRNGGGLFACDGVIRNNLIAVNSAYSGGGLDECDATIENNTICDNAANGMGMVRDGTGGGLNGCSGTIQNCIIWGNSAAGFGSNLHGTSEPTYCCIQNWAGGGLGNTSSDPQFIDPDGPDDDSGTWDDNNYRLVNLAGTSPCVDSGKNETWMWKALDLDGNVRVVKGSSSITVDMGAYEHRSFVFDIVEVDKTPEGQPKITWSSRSGDTYSVWSRPRFPTGIMIVPWTEEASVPSGGETTSWTDPAVMGQMKIYRIELK